MGSRLKKRMFDCIQIKHDDAAAPLLPPNTIHDSRDNSVDGTPRTTQHKNISDARNEYKRMSGGASSIRRQRKFVFGALYTALFPGFFMLDPLEGDFDLIITLPSNQKSVMQIRLASPNDGVGCGRLLSAVLALGRSQRGPGNARGAKVGDIGSMHAFGYRSARTKETFKGTDEHSEKVKTASNMMRHWMEDNMRDVLTFLLNADKSVGVANLLRCIPNGPGSRVMLSVNLGNSAHYDVNDSSISVGVWVEEKPGQSKNWYFILPNVSYKGSQGVVIKLHHGAIISWDGRSIYHCTSSTDVGFDNKVYGCMWGSSPM